MADYQRMYALLFNALTDAVAEIEAAHYGAAAQLLKNAQQEAETIYVETAEAE